MNTSFLGFARLWLSASDLTERLHALVQLLARCYVARAFFVAGLARMRDGPALGASVAGTQTLLSPSLTAGVITGVELVFPVLLLLGFGGRFAAAGLLVVTLAGMAGVPAAALQPHVLLGCLLAFLVLWGPGNYSVDRFIAARMRALTGKPAPGSPRAS